VDPLSKVFLADSGVSPAQFVKLAKTLGLETVPSINMSYSWTALAELLRKHGPLWAAGYWYGSPHIIVITGVEPDGRLYVNDPGSGPKVHDMLFFNTKIASGVGNPIMYLPNSRANQQGFQSFFG
jgi:hypothetical protein